MTYVIIHGSYGSAEGNWFPELKEQLENLGQKVFVPQFPVEDWDAVTKTGSKEKPKKQTLATWLKTFEPIYDRIKNDPQICMIGHSIGPVFILHLVEHYNLKLDSAIFACPFLSTLGGDVWQFDWVNNSFYRHDFDSVKMKQLIPVSYALYSNTDPYVKEAKVFEFAALLNSSLISVTAGGHLSSGVGLKKFPLILELCKSRLDLQLYVNS